MQNRFSSGSGKVIKALAVISITICPFLFVLKIEAQEYAIGADLSFLKSAEDRGFSFMENNISKPGLKIFKDHGYNWIRLRLFHTPVELPNSLDYTITLAKKAKEDGFKFLLDYHYSDTWADPGKQFIPKAWTGLSHGEMVKAVYDYTRETIKAFRKAGVLPTWSRLVTK
jgi:arabinogalactan endo-1,4-beta-galactosidase